MTKVTQAVRRYIRAVNAERFNCLVNESLLRKRAQEKGGHTTVTFLAMWRNNCAADANRFSRKCCTDTIELTVGTHFNVEIRNSDSAPRRVDIRK